MSEKQEYEAWQKEDPQAIIITDDGQRIQRALVSIIEWRKQGSPKAKEQPQKPRVLSGGGIAGISGFGSSPEMQSVRQQQQNKITESGYRIATQEELNQIKATIKRQFPDADAAKLQMELNKVLEARKLVQPGIFSQGALLSAANRQQKVEEKKEPEDSSKYNKLVTLLKAMLNTAIQLESKTYRSPAQQTQLDTQFNNQLNEIETFLTSIDKKILDEVVAWGQENNRYITDIKGGLRIPGGNINE